MSLKVSPGGFVANNTNLAFFGLLKIKCFESKKHLKPSRLICDENFYVKLENNSSPVFKKETSKWLLFSKFSLQWDYLPFCFATLWFALLRG